MLRAKIKSAHRCGCALCSQGFSCFSLQHKTQQGQIASPHHPPQQVRSCPVPIPGLWPWTCAGLS